MLAFYPLYLPVWLAEFEFETRRTTICLPAWDSTKVEVLASAFDSKLTLRLVTGSAFYTHLPLLGRSSPMAFSPHSSCRVHQPEAAQ